MNNGPDLTVHAGVRALSDAQQRAATRLVQRRANDAEDEAEDEAELLAILGLPPAPDPTAPGGQR
ncbi:MAG: hypothetical protein M3R09_11200 [Actinomycetota bacterium]|nr:hypothetical protein [Actinomycetota bacterium]